MPHAYPLHTDVTVACLCCRAPRTFRFSSTADQVVCGSCVNHLGQSKAERRDAEHVEMWSALYSVEQDVHRAEVARLESSVSAAEAGLARLRDENLQLTAVAAHDFAGGASGGVRDLIQNDVVRRAERNTELANLRTDRMMAVLWRIDALHHATDAAPALCACGKPARGCPEFLAVEPERQILRDWERKNLALAREGVRHALPAEHPRIVQ